MSEHWDVVVIGTGAGGATLAWRLAQTEKRVLLLERGGFLPREHENWDPHEVATRGRYRANVSFYDANDQPFSPYTHYWVGGNTKMYGGALIRMRESDFGEVRHFAGVSPAWPIEYAELEPYYGRAERLYSVHGERGTDPFEPWASHPYPHPALAHEPRIAELADDLARHGVAAFPLPIAVRLPPDGQAPVNLSLFDGYPDPTKSKADAHVCAIEPALERANVTLWTHAYAERLLAEGSGREVTGVVVLKDGERVEIEADVVVVACGAIESAALFLRSACSAHPNGLANGSGLVGRNYMTHQNGSVVWITRTPNPSRFQKTLGITDFYRGADDSDRPLGTVQLMGRTDREDLAAQMRGVVEDRTVEEASACSIDFWLTAEDLPALENRVSLRSDGSIRIEYTKNNTEAYARLKAKLKSTLDRIEDGGVYTGYELGIGGVSHQCGTLRFGTDPASSVLDVRCKAHELDNLYVCDASFFVSSAAVNPSLTIMANALRVADHLVERLR